VTTDTKPPPRIWPQGYGYACNDPHLPGRIVYADERRELERLLGIADSAAEVAAAKRTAQQAAEQARRDAAAEQVPALRAAADEAAERLAAARAALTAAADDDPIIVAYRTLVAAVQADNQARAAAAQAEAEATGSQRAQWGEVRVPTLVEALSAEAGSPRSPDTVYGPPR
jgi:hypothetical protein